MKENKTITPEIVDKNEEKKEFNIETEDIVLGGVSIALIAGTVLLGGFVASAVLTGGISCFAALFLLYKSRKHCPRVWNLAIDHPLLSDVAITGGFVIIMGASTATALLAVGTAGVLTSVGINFAKKYVGRIENVKPMNLKVFSQLHK